MRMLLATFLLLLSCKAPAHAGPVEDAMLEHIDWITANSGFEYAGEELPEVLTVPQENLANMVASDPGFEVVAVYDQFTNTILFPEGTDPLAFENANALVHELVHFLQMVNGHFYEGVCIAGLEPPAHKLGDRWMDAHDHPGQRSDPMFVFLKGLSCQSRIH